jgi:hypothetical protein
MKSIHVVDQKIHLDFLGMVGFLPFTHHISKHDFEPFNAALEAIVDGFEFPVS